MKHTITVPRSWVTITYHENSDLMTIKIADPPPVDKEVKIGELWERN